MWTYIAIAIGGVIGCWARFGMTNLVQAVYGREFPYATLSINLLGSFLMGFLFIDTLERLTMSPELRAGILTGGLGGFTTSLDLRDGDAAAGRAGQHRQGGALYGAFGRHRLPRRLRRRLSRPQPVRSSVP